MPPAPPPATTPLREVKNSVEIYVPDEWFQEISIQPGYNEKVRDVVDTLLKAGLANTTGVVVSMMILPKESLSCAQCTVLELRGDIARMFGYLNNTAIRASDKKGFTLALPEINIFMFIQISSRANIMVMLLFLSSYCYSKGRTWKLC